MGETVSMPVRAFLDSDIPIRRKEKMGWLDETEVSMPVRAFLDSDAGFGSAVPEEYTPVSMPVRAFLDSDLGEEST